MLQKFHFQTKLFLNYSIIVVMIIALSIVAFYIYISSTIAAQAIENLYQLTLKTSQQLDGMVQEMDRIALQIVINPTINEIFAKVGQTDHRYNYFQANLNEKRKIVDILTSINGPNISYPRISIYNNRGDYLSTGIFPETPALINQRLRSREYALWYSRQLTYEGSRILIPPHPDYWSHDRQTILFSLIREIQDLNLYANYALVEIQQPYAQIENICRFQNGGSGRTYLLDKGGALIYPHRESFSRRNHALEYYFRRLPRGDHGHIWLKDPRRQTKLIIYSRSQISDWVLLYVQDRKDLLAPVQLARRVLLAAGLGILLLTLAIIFLITQQLTKPLQELRNSISKVSLENLAVDLGSSQNNDEITLLNSAFQEMFQRLKNSLDQLMVARAEEVKAQLLALQSQMNPHFLFNMLAVISAAGQEAGETRITEMCHRLSSMLRYVTAYDSKEVTIRDELAQAQNYLELMKERYEERFQYTLQVDETVLDMKVPKLILQPLAENCFQHGFYEVKPPWRIEIVIGRDRDQWLITVSDNGAGFDEAVFADLLDKAAQFSSNPAAFKELKLGGLGLLNTLLRLKFLYQSNLIFKVQPNSPRGTRITIGGDLCD